MWKPQSKLQHGTQNVNTHGRTTQKTKKYEQHGLTKKKEKEKKRKKVSKNKNRS